MLSTTRTTLSAKSRRLLYTSPAVLQSGFSGKGFSYQTPTNLPPEKSHSSGYPDNDQGVTIKPGTDIPKKKLDESIKARMEGKLPKEDETSDAVPGYVYSSSFIRLPLTSLCA